MKHRLLIPAAVVTVLAVFSATAGATFPSNGAPLYVYQETFNGLATIPNYNDPASFNTAYYGGPTPPPGDLLGTSQFDGTSTDLTASGNQPPGVIVVNPCTGFTYNNANGCAAASTATTSNETEFMTVQSWPFYVGSSTSSNVNPGTFAVETQTDDGSWMTLSGQAYTYAQPGNFQNTAGLTAGVAAVDNGGMHSPAGVTSTFTIPGTGECATNLYYLTFEYFEAAGGQASVGYSWQPPGAPSQTTIPQAVVWGQVLYNGQPEPGATISIPLPGGGTVTVTSDTSGCFGYNYPPTWAGALNVGTVKATDTPHGSRTQKNKNTIVTMGDATFVQFSFPNPVPYVNLFKRITQIQTKGPTPAPGATYQTVVPTPDPNNPPGVAGTANTLNVYPGDIVTYTIYFDNSGSTPAYYPNLTDVLSPDMTYVLGSATGTCCINPTVSIPITPSVSGNTVTWTLATPLPTASPLSPQTIQGNVSVQAKVN